jgi:hypothetical protein
MRMPFTDDGPYDFGTFDGRAIWGEPMIVKHRKQDTPLHRF